MEEKKRSIFLTEITFGCTIIEILIFKLFHTFLIVSTKYDADILHLSFIHIYT